MSNTTVEQMGNMKPHSKEWFKAAFEGVQAPDEVKDAAMMICHAYGIYGQADPGYIANVIQGKMEHRERPFFHENDSNKTKYGI